MRWELQIRSLVLVVLAVQMGKCCIQAEALEERRREAKIAIAEERLRVGTRRPSGVVAILVAVVVGVFATGRRQVVPWCWDRVERNERLAEEVLWEKTMNTTAGRNVASSGIPLSK